MPARTPMSPAELERLKGEMSPRERRCFEKMREALREPTKTLTWYWKFGRAVLSLRGREEPGERYGWMSRLARSLDCSRDFLHKVRVFASNYTAPEVQSLAREGVTWGLTYSTFTIKDKECQKEWIRRARNHKWSVHELEKEIQRARQGRRSAGGRRPGEPRSFGPVVDLQDLVRMTGAWLRHFQGVWAQPGQRLEDRLAALPPEGQSPHLLEQIRTADQSLQEIAEAAAGLRQNLQDLIRKMGWAESPPRV